MAENKNIGVYICSGYGIGEAIDCNLLAEEAGKLGGVAVTKIMKDLCTPAGRAQIEKDIEESGLNGIVIGASSPRYHTDLFKFPEIVTERISLRELVAWTHTPNDKHTQDLALDYLKMGVAKVDAALIPEPMILDNISTILVVGGGVTGMNAALAAAGAGYPVVIVEKEDTLGGFYGKLHKLTPLSEPYKSLEPNQCGQLIAEVAANPNIQVFTGTKILKTSGQPGMFDVTAQRNGDTLEFQAGAIIQATGWRPYDAAKLDKLGYGIFKNVVTNIELEQRAKEGIFTRPSDGKPIKNIVFVQCAGSRDPEHLPYCSSVCCMTSLKQSLYYREQYPDANIYIVYKHIRTPGQYEMFYKHVQNKDNIFLTKGEIAGMEEAGDDKIFVNIDDTLLGREIRVEADMVVLATGMVPTMMPDREPAEGETQNLDILNLTYRQGPDMPTLKYGFPDSHYICFPYETRRTGIYAAGVARSPMDSASSKNDAYGAAMKAIQIIENINAGTAVHPRSGEKAFAEFFLQRCTQCKRCTEECPFGSLDEDTKGTPKYNPNRCRRCGICMGACPERIISFKDYSVFIVSQMIKSIYIPTEEQDGEATPRIIAFLCENDAYPSLDMAAGKHAQFSPHIRIIPVRCLGSVNTSWIADSLSQGFDGVILIGCKYGDDYQCHYIKGSELANRRMENVQEKLKQLVLEPGSGFCPGITL